MRKNISLKMSWLVRFLILIFIFFSFEIWNHWGENQQLNPKLISNSIHTGMSMSEVDKALNLPNAFCENNNYYFPHGNVYHVYISNIGWGVFFKPQHEILLGFDASLRLTLIHGKFYHGIEDETIQFNGFK